MTGKFRPKKEATPECLRVTVNAMRHRGVKKMYQVIDRVISQGFKREEVFAALRHIGAITTEQDKPQ